MGHSLLKTDTLHSTFYASLRQRAKTSEKCSINIYGEIPENFCGFISILLGTAKHVQAH